MTKNEIITSVFNRSGTCTTTIQNPSPRVHTLMVALGTTCQEYDKSGSKRITYHFHRDIGTIDKMFELFLALDACE